MPCSHFIAKITVRGGPDPERELRHLLSQSRSNTDHVAWFASTYSGADFERAGNSICVIFREIEGESAIEAVVARILTRERQPAPGVGTPEREFYSDYAGRLNNWWRLGGHRAEKAHPDIALIQLPSLAVVPGSNWDTERRATETFKAQATISGWDFRNEIDPLGWLQELAAKELFQNNLINFVYYC